MSELNQQIAVLIGCVLLALSMFVPPFTRVWEWAARKTGLGPLEIVFGSLAFLVPITLGLMGAAMILKAEKQTVTIHNVRTKTGNAEPKSRKLSTWWKDVTRE